MTRIYLINAESGIPMFKQVVQTLGATITTSVLAFDAGASDETNLDMLIIDGLFKDTQMNIEVYGLEDGDSVVFEMPVFAISQEIATGMSIYMANINAAVALATDTPDATVKVLFYSNILGG